jgi:glycosyltransferase involved in cell wall biosynthesis
MKVVVLTTSYPRDADDISGHFVRDAVEGVRSLGVDVDVVSPASFPHFGIAYGDGIAQNLRGAPWKLALVPAFLGSFALAARRAAGDADLVHAHWIPSALAARATGKPYVLQVWGTDVELARRAPALVRPLVAGARLVIGASSYLVDEARRLGAKRVEVVPSGVHIPAHVSDPVEPPHVLYVGRLSEEKGVLDFLAATSDVPRVVVGDGPLRDRVPDAVGFVAPADLGAYYARAAVVCVPSRREGYGMTAREAMAYGRPLVATKVGGLADLGPEARLVPSGDVGRLREAIIELLTDRDARVESGERARARASTEWSKEATAALLVELYR